MADVTDPIEDLVAEVPGSTRCVLAGSRCRRCKEVLFPAMRDCPVCLEPDVMEGYQLAGHGTISDYVVAERGPEGFPVPYVQAWLKLDDGPVVFSIIETPDPRSPEHLTLGSPATMVRRRFGADGSAFTGWKFVPDSLCHD
ncbi:MAG TPA: zinc ribbon domain-containing protein [Amycolatopsis sp.]|nr:zinc ribbon domain-containing protein [Amycolatopsis sp.]